MALADRLTGWLVSGRTRATSRDSDRAALPTTGMYNLLAAFRFGAVSALVALTVVLESRESLQTSIIVLVTWASAYSVLLVALGSRLATLRYGGYVVISLDMMLGVAGILVGGGMDSAFLLYALVPVLTAALLMNRAFTMALALVPGITVVGAHTIGSFYFDRFGWILEANYLTLLPVYAAVSLGMGLLPFYANLNLRRVEQAQVRRSEQRRLRAELHDKLAQSLSSLTMGLRQVRRVGGSSEQLSEMVEVSERSYADLRELFDLLEAGAWQPTAVGTLERLVEGWAEESGISVEASFPTRDLELPPERAIAILGIGREALTNVGKHSGATKVWVRLENQPGGTLLQVHDNGRGFSKQKASGHGRRIMQERAESVHASLVITSEPGQGTEVRLWCPQAT